MPEIYVTGGREVSESDIKDIGLVVGNVGTYNINARASMCDLLKKTMKKNKKLKSKYVLELVRFILPDEEYVDIKDAKDSIEKRVVRSLHNEAKGLIKFLGYEKNISAKLAELKQAVAEHAPGSANFETALGVVLRKIARSGPLPDVPRLAEELPKVPAEPPIPVAGKLLTDNLQKILKKQLALKNYVSEYEIYQFRVVMFLDEIISAVPQRD